MRDVLGAWLSFLCLLHCALPLLLVSFGASLGMNQVAESIHAEWLHIALLLPVVGILSVSLPKAYLSHRNPQPAILAIIGIVTLVMGVVFGNQAETILTLIGSVLVIYSHLLNRRTLKTLQPVMA